jgi:hypothetical protein
MRFNIDISQIRDVVKVLLENEGDNEVVISPEQYTNFLKFAGYDGRAVQNMKQFRGKRIVVDGNLDLSKTDAKNITNITVKGDLNVSYTQVNSLEGVEVTQYVAKYGTPLEKILIKKERAKKKVEQDSLRENDEWNLETASSDIATCANVLFEYLISSVGDFEAKEPGDDERLKQLYAEKERREEIETETEDNENLMDLETVIEEIEELEKRIDLYNLVYDYRYYGMRVFYVLTNDLEETKERWAVGDERTTYRAAYEKVDGLIDDIGITGFNASFVENHLDEEELKDYFREDEENNVRENLEDYFDEDEFEYSDPKVQERIDEINARLEDSEIDQEEYDELNEELDELKDSDKTIPEDLIEDKVEDLVNDLVSGTAMSVIENYGLNLADFINLSDFKKDVIDSDGIGHTLNSYDGTEDTIEFNDEEYYILQIEG